MKNVEQQLHDYFQSLPEAKRAPAPTTAEYLDSTPTEPDMNNTPRTLAVAAVALIAFGIGLFALLGGGDDNEVDVTDSFSRETTTTTEAELTTSSLAPEPDESVDERAATLATAERFVDALVGSDPEALQLVAADDFDPRETLFNIAFDSAANARTLERVCESGGPSAAVCIVRSRDDLDVLVDGPEAFHTVEVTIFVAGGEVVQASYFYDDSRSMQRATEWALQQGENPDEGPCLGWWVDTASPTACAEALLEALAEYPNRYDAVTATTERTGG